MSVRNLMVKCGVCTPHRFGNIFVDRMSKLISLLFFFKINFSKVVVSPMTRRRFFLSLASLNCIFFISFASVVPFG